MQDLTILGALNHDGTTVGLYAATPVVQAANEPDLDDQTGGGATDTLDQIPDAVAADVDLTAASLASVNTSIGTLNDDLASLAAKVNAVLVTLKEIGIMAADA